MDQKLIHQSNTIYFSNLEHCKDFKFTDLKLSTAAQEIWKGKDTARVPAVYFFNKYVKELNLQSKKLLTFGGKEDLEVKVLPHEVWIDSEYWTDQRDDVEDLSKSTLDKDFDFILINQTFEHLTDIEAAIVNIKDRLVPGGYMYANFPTLNIPHGIPYFFFTGVAVQLVIYLCIKHGLKIIRSGHWGNFDYIDYIYRNLTWPDYTKINLDNDVQRPCIGWVLVQK